MGPPLRSLHGSGRGPLLCSFIFFLGPCDPYLGVFPLTYGRRRRRQVLFFYKKTFFLCPMNPQPIPFRTSAGRDLPASK